MRVHLVAAVLVSSLAILSAQDPSPPPGGFTVQRVEYAAGNANGPVTWVDGVRTELDLYHPVHASPPSGWPAVLVIHGGQADRRVRFVRERCIRLARMGYLCIAYDVRGDGATVALNPPGFAATQADALRDMADAFARSPSLLPGGVTMDPARLAVTGDSQGGRHSFRAAAWSGQALPLPYGAVTQMPSIAAIAPRIAPLSVPDDAVPNDGVLANAHTVTNLWQERGGNPADPLVQVILAEDWHALRTVMAADPLIDFLPRLRSSTVPMLIGFAWNDHKHALWPTIDALGTLPPGVIVRTLWSTSGHSSVPNAIEEEFTDDQIRRWFDRFLKGIANGIDREPPAEVAQKPVDPTRHQSLASAWTHAGLDAWPPSDSQIRSFWLRGGGLLATTAPAAIEPGPTLRHRVTPGYDIAAFCADDRRPNLVLARIPLVEASFLSAPLGSDHELLGRSVLRVSVDANAGEFFVAAGLYAIAPDGTATFVACGADGRRSTGAGRHALEIVLDDVAMVVPAGHSLRLVLRNLALEEPPGQRFIRWTPSFRDSDVALRIDPADAPRLELRIADLRHPMLTPRLARGSIGTGIDQSLRIEAGVALAGAPYVVLMSGSGHWPGVPLPNPMAPGATLPLNLDAWTSLSSQLAGAAPFVGTIGVLDGTGTASARFALPPLPALASLAGLRFTFAAGGIDASARLWASNPIEFDVLP